MNSPSVRWGDEQDAGDTITSPLIRDRGDNLISYRLGLCARSVTRRSKSSATSPRFITLLV